MLVFAPLFLGPKLEDLKPERPVLTEGPFVHLPDSGCWLLAVGFIWILGWSIHLTWAFS